MSDSDIQAHFGTSQVLGPTQQHQPIGFDIDASSVLKRTLVGQDKMLPDYFLECNAIPARLISNRSA